MNRWQDGYLTRDEVVRLLDADHHWNVTYCSGSNRLPASGHGAPLPPGVLERVPTPAAKRKLRRGTTSRTYFRAELSEVGHDHVLVLVEDL